MEQQLANIQVELTQSQQHVARLGAALDTLRNESSTAVANLRAQLEAQTRAEDRHVDGGGKGKKLIHTKTLEPKKFAGKDEEDYKEWAKSIKNFLNAQTRGFRKILEWAEECTTAVDADDIELLVWDGVNVVDANEALYDYLTMITTNKALLLVEQTPERGFEAWRRLAHRHNPLGGQLELVKMQHLLHKTAVKSLTELPAAVDAFEKEIELYNKRNTNNFPE